MPTPQWPDHLPAPAEAAAWISRSLPGQPAVIGPLHIAHAKSWGVVATFQAQPPHGPAQTVVFKASHLPLFTHAPRIDQLLMRHCPGDTPQLLAAQSWPDRVWSIYRPFSGPTVAELNSLPALVALAEHFARIQVRVAACPAEALAGLPRSPLQDLPGALSGIRQDLVDKHLPRWQARGELAEHGLPGNLLQRLDSMAPQLSAWADALHAAHWPTSLDHVDLHGNNAVQTPGGPLLIFDWEEAVLGLPFFSLDRLLDDARELDEQRGTIPPHWPGRYSPAEQAVCDAYLRALPWGRLADRAQALDLALCLAPLKTLQEGRVFAQTQGWQQGIPGQAAQLLAKACRRWDHAAHTALRAAA